MIKSQFKKRHFLFLTSLLLLISIVLFRPSIDKILLAIVVWIAYFTGLFALLFGVVFSLFGYLSALPIISTMYAYIAFILAKIHYIIFRAFMNRTLRRMDWYRKIELKVKNSKIVKESIKIFHGFLRGLGIDKSRRVKFFEVTGCESCQRSMPTDGTFCPYCGEKVN